MEQPQNPLQIPIIGVNKISFGSLRKFDKPTEICLIIMNLITWSFLILIIITQMRIKKLEEDGMKSEIDDEKYKRRIFLVFGGLSYLQYFMQVMISKTFQYLKVKENKIIKEKMGDIYKTNPTINLVVESYHM